MKDLGKKWFAFSKMDIANVNIAEKLDKEYEELNKVLGELQDLKIENKVVDKKEITKELRDELFMSLQQFTSKRRVKQCHEIIDELNLYRLNNDDGNIITKVEELLNQRKYKKIIGVLVNGK